MKKEWLWFIGLAICIFAILPWTVLKWQKPLRNGGQNFTIRVLLPSGKIEKMSLEEYLVGVVAAEMPAAFEVEALKAQAVAARTYAAKQINRASAQDVGYDVDTTVQTQSWLSSSDLRKRWGGWVAYWRYQSRIEQAVRATTGLVMVTNGDYIDAFYHASSGRKPTENAADVWGSARPYLINVDPQEDSPLRFVRSVTFTPQELAAKLKLNRSVQTFAAADIQLLSRTRAGRVKELRVFGAAYPVGLFRTLLGLASADIEWAIQPDQVTFVTYGSGHAVGMSQYGANDMAKKGRTYQEILAHFYPGTNLLTLTHK